MTKLEEFILANPEVLAAAVGRNGGSTPTYEECPDCHLPKGHLDGHGGGGSNPSGGGGNRPSVSISGDKDGVHVSSSMPIGKVSLSVGADWKPGNNPSLSTKVSMPIGNGSIAIGGSWKPGSKPSIGVTIKIPIGGGK